uniref:RRM domain-containing protein n=1 Tax=Panagrellus redivivus TaxID=6233 RepID=A0A7E4VJC2_PANRE
MSPIDTASTNGSIVSALSNNSQPSFLTQQASSATKKPSMRALTDNEKAEIDARSFYIGNVEYAATEDLLEAHFKGCGAINRVSIMRDRFSGKPKGHAYVEFDEVTSASNAVLLDDTFFMGRQIKISPKRTNKPGISTTNRAPRGRGKPVRIGVRRGGFGGAARSCHYTTNSDSFNRGRGAAFRGRARGRRGIS